jgi:DNA-binding MarR family transcriptional regulator
MGTSKQAASKLIDVMEGAGYVRRGAGSTDTRQRPVRLTPRGRRLLAAVEVIYAELEQRWADVIGASNVERVRRDLTEVLAVDGELPAVRPTW